MAAKIFRLFLANGVLENYQVPYVLITRISDGAGFCEATGKFFAGKLPTPLRLVKKASTNLYNVSEARQLWSDGLYVAVFMISELSFPFPTKDFFIDAREFAVSNDEEVSMLTVRSGSSSVLSLVNTNLSTGSSQELKASIQRILTQLSLLTSTLEKRGGKY